MLRFLNADSSGGKKKATDGDGRVQHETGPLNGNYSVLYTHQIIIKKKEKRKKKKKKKKRKKEEGGGRRRKKEEEEEEGEEEGKRKKRREEEEEEGRKKKGTLARKQVKKTGKGHGGFNSIPHFILE